MPFDVPQKLSCCAGISSPCVFPSSTPVRPAMLRRNSSRNQQRRPLGRSKSTNCIARNPVLALKSIAPKDAERDAHIAATLSYHRALRRADGNMAPVAGDTPGLVVLGNSRIPGRQGLSKSDSMVGNEQSSFNNVGGLKRQKSIRFAGPDAKPRRILATRATTNVRSATSGHLKSKLLDNIRSVSAARAEPSLRRDDDLQSLNGSYICSVQDSEAFYVARYDTGSAPSTLRKLRKSRSMFTAATLPSSDYCFTNSPAEERPKKFLDGFRYSYRNKENEPLGTSASVLRAPKSMTLLHNRREPTFSGAGSCVQNNLAVHLAGDKFRQQVEQQTRLKSQPSTFFRSRFKISESSAIFPRSLRQSSNNSTAISSAFSGTSISISKQTRLRRTARRVSRSLKDKLKGLFARQKSAEYTTDRSEEQAIVPSCDGATSFDGREHPFSEEASVSQVPSRVPSLHAVPSSQQMRSRQGSFESVGEDAQVSDEKSRVTSWTNSVSNTMENPQTWGEWERQRLSVIKETGMHVTSSSMNRTPQHQSSSTAPAHAPPTYAVDSQRVYAALMERLQDTRVREEQLRKRSIEDIRSHGIAPSRSSSMNQLASRSWSPPTIRCVQSEDDVFQDGREGEYMYNPPDSPGSIIRRHKCTTSTINAALDAQPSLGQARFGSESAQKTNPSPGLTLPQSRSQRSTAFFASPQCHLFRTASPYRRAIQETMNRSGTAQPRQTILSPATQHFHSLSELSLPTRHPSPSRTEDDQRLGTAESIYSFATEEPGQDSAQIGSSLMENFPEPPNTTAHGEATIFVDHSKYKPSASQRREVSSTSSIEWKTWLSAHVSKLETPNMLGRDETTAKLPLVSPRSGHVREDAEIEPCEHPLSLKPSRSTIVSTNTPLQPLERNLRSNSTQTKTVRAETFPGLAADENSAPPRSKTLLNPPPIPPRSALRTTPSLPYVKSHMPQQHENSLPRARSLNTLIKSNASTRELLFSRRSRTRLGAGQGSSGASTPALTAAFKRQFGSVTAGSPCTGRSWASGLRVGNMTIKTNRSQDDMTVSAAARSELDAQAMGSKTMVDLFLSSRRKKMHGGTSTMGSDSSPAAFI